MANASTTGFGFRPIKKVGQNYNNDGLSEWNVAASSALISHACNSAINSRRSCSMLQEILRC